MEVGHSHLDLGKWIHFRKYPQGLEGLRRKSWEESGENCAGGTVGGCCLASRLQKGPSTLLLKEVVTGTKSTC